MAINNDVNIPLVLNYLNKKPDILNLSNGVPPHTILDWKGGDVVGKEYAREVRFLPRLNYSTTDIIKKIRA